MKYLLVLLTIAMALPHSATAETVHPLRVMTFNVLVDVTLGGKEDEYPKWEQRKSLAVNAIREAAPDLLGTQETSPAQVEFLRSEFPEYAVLGELPFEFGGENLSDAMPLLKSLGMTAYTDVMLWYRRDLFELIEDRWFSLSPTPEKLANGFGNFLPRVLVWARLKHRPSGTTLFVANTHFDNSSAALPKMAALTQEKLTELLPEPMPALLMGDFNTDQKRGDFNMLVSNGWKDSYTASPLASAGGRDENVPTHDRNTRIDHIFYRGLELTPKTWKRIESPDADIPLSDHFPVFAVFELRAK